MRKDRGEVCSQLDIYFAERLPFPEKPVSKSFVASLSPVYAKQAIFELFHERSVKHSV